MIGGEATELIKVFRKEKVSKEFNYVDFQNELANNYPNIPEIYRDVILKDTADQINLIQILQLVKKSELLELFWKNTKKKKILILS